MFSSSSDDESSESIPAPSKLDIGAAAFASWLSLSPPFPAEDDDSSESDPYPANKLSITAVLKHR
jgi:hypothetical protein